MFHSLPNKNQKKSLSKNLKDSYLILILGLTPILISELKQK